MLELQLAAKLNPLLEEMFEFIPSHIKKRCVVKKFEADTIILRKEEDIKDIYFVCSGTIRVINEFSNGTIYGFAYVEPGDVIGAMELLSGNQILACTLETLTDSTIISMSVEDFMSWFEEDHGFSKAIARMIARKFFPTSFDYGLVFKEDAVNAVALYIFKIVRSKIDSEECVNVKVTRKFLSEELGISTRTVYRSLKKLLDLNYLEIEKGVICVRKNQYEKLKEFLEK